MVWPCYEETTNSSINKVVSTYEDECRENEDGQSFENLEKASRKDLLDLEITCGLWDFDHIPWRDKIHVDDPATLGMSYEDDEDEDYMKKEILLG